MSHSGWPCSRASQHRRRGAISRHLRRRQRPRYRLTPSTPLLRWNSNLHRRGHNNADTDAGSSSAALAISSRQLAAGLWHLRFGELSSAAEPPRDRLAPPLESSLPYPNYVAERATEGKPGCSKASNADDNGNGNGNGNADVCYLVSHRKIIAGKRVSEESLVSELQAELAKARSRVRDLEAKKHSMRNKVKSLLMKLEEERMPRQRREERKINNEAINELRERLMRERKIRRRMEILNTKLVTQLAEINSSSEQLVKDYEEEKKSRELLEELCDKLVQRITEDKARVERLKSECVRVGEELEEERRMLQLAEVWREERVQMKLVDAKIALEGKFSMMNSLINELATLLRSASSSLDIGDLRKAEEILQAAAKSLTAGDFVEEFVYVPPKSNDMLSILRELRECEGDEREIGASGDDSAVASPEINRFDKSILVSNRFSDYNSALEEVAGVQSSSQSSPISAKMSKVILAKKAKHNVSPVSKIGRSKSPDIDDRKFSNGVICGVEATSPGRKAGETERRRRGQRISACLENPHVARGMRGCIEWPRVIQKTVLKPKISQTIIESHKSQLRNILKPQPPKAI